MQFVFLALFEFIGTMLVPGPDSLAKRPVWVRLLYGLGVVIVALLGAVLLTFVVAFFVGAFQGLRS